MNQNNRKIALIIGVVALVVLAGVGGYFLARQRPSPVVLQNNLTNEPLDNNSQEIPAPPSPPTTNDYKLSGQVEWQKPVKITTITVFDPPDITDYSTDASYKVGKFVAGPYTGADFIYALASCDCMGNGILVRGAKQGNKYTVFAKYSDEIDSNVDHSKFTVDENFTLSDLNFPEKIKGPNPRQILELASIPFSAHNFFTVDKNIKLVFTDPVLGPVYTTADKTDDSLNDYPFRQYGFYLKAPDSSIVVYEMTPDFVGDNNVPEVTWNDKTKNTKEYTYQDMGGCGFRNYTSVMAPDVLSQADLTLAGTNSKGDPIYTLKNPNHSLLKDLYDNHYYVPEGQQKMSYADFIKTRPLFFWRDPFGRLVKFQNSQFMPQAECAKPVIYLYPTQPQQVNVQLAPQGGFSASEPAYNSGWNVWADPSGNLTDLASGLHYPYLFWEGRGGLYETPKKGFVVARANVSTFLDQKLTQLGLNNREADDFKEFWLPKMQDQPYYFVTFMNNSVMDKIAPLNISPKPDSVIRILMDFTPLQKPVRVEGFEIRTPKRQGFTVVEWGGVLH